MLIKLNTLFSGIIQLFSSLFIFKSELDRLAAENEGLRSLIKNQKEYYKDYTKMLQESLKEERFENLKLVDQLEAAHTSLEVEKGRYYFLAQDFNLLEKQIRLVENMYATKSNLNQYKRIQKKNNSDWIVQRINDETTILNQFKVLMCSKTFIGDWVVYYLDYGHIRTERISQRVGLTTYLSLNTLLSRCQDAEQIKKIGKRD
ncbi:hypothetical protein [Paenibacillus agricola]|uniref:Uncharacterized protein n=1 Tax=Paenibacillus agricola TaxID=2716264 RepID=A0ABX0JHQ9_9BACL|nr:hypothetical protein [Paenibacillus agricola]NHN35513.1 hypothetical protein [Paenibacillus agricola]